MASPSEHIGRRFGRLLVLAVDKPRHLLCRCDCGVERVVRTQDLRTGVTRSCGCLRREASAERQRDTRSPPLPVGTRSGRLTTLDLGTETRVRCRCDCGQESVVLTAKIRYRTTLSCGCSRRDLVALTETEQRALRLFIVRYGRKAIALSAINARDALAGRPVRKRIAVVIRAAIAKETP